jgi:hypothetical protein
MSSDMLDSPAGWRTAGIRRQIRELTTKAMQGSC